jgi:hypothetical protein
MMRSERPVMKAGSHKKGTPIPVEAPPECRLRALAFITGRSRWASGSELDVAIDAVAKDNFQTLSAMIYGRRVSVFTTTASVKLA